MLRRRTRSERRRAMGAGPKTPKRRRPTRRHAEVLSRRALERRHTETPKCGMRNAEVLKRPEF
eukprot:6230253-Alexandrium_andersonii.AAC.1